MIRSLLLIFSLGSLLGCKNTESLVTAPASYLTRNVVIVVIDGPRYSETWGAENKLYIPNLARKMAPEGIVNTAFYNDGYTYTNSGHAAITTGVRQGINNRGAEIPRFPSFFQYWLQATGQPNSKAWLITSKDKLNILADTKQKDYQGKYQPAYSSGINGPYSGYREDSVTLRVAKQVLAREQPNLLLINFKEPDASGHANDWAGYLKGIRDTDRYLFELWNYLQTDPNYSGTTTLFVTNDHGRHLDGVGSGFVSHGDGCSGCRHLNFFASGPDFKKNKIIDTHYDQTDIPATIAELMGFKMPHGEGEVMWQLFNGK